MKLEHLVPGSFVAGILTDDKVAVVSVQCFGTSCIELTHKTPSGRSGNELLYIDAEARLEVIEADQRWSFDGDGELIGLVLGAKRILFAHLFDPGPAVHAPVVDPLLHQITAVYKSMLSRQPLRFLLALMFIAASIAILFFANRPKSPRNYSTRDSRLVRPTINRDQPGQ